MRFIEKSSRWERWHICENAIAYFVASGTSALAQRVSMMYQLSSWETRDRQKRPQKRHHHRHTRRPFHDKDSSLPPGLTGITSSGSDPASKNLRRGCPWGLDWTIKYRILQMEIINAEAPRPFSRGDTDHWDTIWAFMAEFGQNEALSSLIVALSRRTAAEKSRAPRFSIMTSLIF